MAALKAITKLVGILAVLWLGLAFLGELSAATRWGVILVLGVGYLAYLIEDSHKRQEALLEKRFDRLEELLLQLDGSLLTPYVTNELDDWAAERKRSRREANPL